MILNFTNGNPLPASLAAMDEKVVMTLIALCILEEMFDDHESEWLMIAEKAKTFLTHQKVNIIREMDLILDELF